jgi:putative ribosome biogenesis GTPase RsgA
VAQDVDPEAQALNQTKKKNKSSRMSWQSGSGKSTCLASVRPSGKILERERQTDRQTDTHTHTYTHTHTNKKEFDKRLTYLSL